MGARENGGEHARLAGKRPDERAFQYVPPGGPVECQVAPLVTISYVLENTEAEIEGMKDVKS